MFIFGYKTYHHICLYDIWLICFFFFAILQEYNGFVRGCIIKREENSFFEHYI